MPRMKDDEIRFRHALAATGKQIDEVNVPQLARECKVNIRRARYFAKQLRGSELPPLPVEPPADEAAPVEVEEETNGHV